MVGLARRARQMTGKAVPPHRSTKRAGASGRIGSDCPALRGPRAGAGLVPAPRVDLKWPVCLLPPTDVNMEMILLWPL